jgi:leucine dehydrogenase
MRDALRLSRGMSYKNAMAGLPMGGGKAVVLLDAQKTKTPEMLAAFGDAIDALGGRYVTAEDVGASEADMVAISQRTPHVCGLPVGEGDAGGDPGPFTALGIFLGIKAAVAHKLGSSSLKDVRVALQGSGSVGSGVARLLAKEGARLTVADVDAANGRGAGGGSRRHRGGGGRGDGRGLRRVQPNAARGDSRRGGIALGSTARSSPAGPTTSSRGASTARCAPRGILYSPDSVIKRGGDHQT